MRKCLKLTNFEASQFNLILGICLSYSFVKSSEIGVAEVITNDLKS